MNEKLRLLVIPEMFPQHSEDIAGVYTLDYIRAVQHFCEVEVFYPRLSGAPGLISEDDPRGFRIHRYHLMSGNGGWLKQVHYIRWFAQALQEAKKLGKFDLIHAHGPLLHGNLAVQLGHHFNIPVVVSVHTGPFSVITKNPFYRRMAQRSISKCELVLAVSNHLKSEIEKAGMHARQIEVSGNPINDELFALADRSEPRKMMIFVSRLDEFKGALRTLMAFHRVSEKLPEWRLVIAGVGEELEAVERYVAQHGLSEKVRITGTLSKDSLNLLMMGADFMVFPSRHETFGLIVQEALSTGMPVIASNTTAVGELVNSKMGVMVNPDDIDEIGDAMVHLAQNPENYKGSELREMVVSRFGIKAFGKRMEKHYKSLLKACAELPE